MREYRDERGGVAKSIHRKAEELYAEKGLTPERDEALRRAFVGLARLTDDGAYIRRSVCWAVIDPTVRDIVERFIAARMLVADTSGSAADGGQAGTEERVVAVAHEALFRDWPRLHGWLRSARRNHAAAERIRTAMQRWKEAGSPPDDLLLRPGRET